MIWKDCLYRRFDNPYLVKRFCENPLLIEYNSQDSFQYFSMILTHLENYKKNIKKTMWQTHYPSTQLRLAFTILYISMGLLLTSCGIYSFSGVSTTAKSILIGNFQNRAGNGPPNLGINFTEKLKDYYQRNSTLDIVSQNGELTITGNIIKYEMTPIAPTGEDRAAQNRLTISVEIDFINTQDEKKNFKQPFSFYSDFPQNQTLAQVENAKIEEIFEQIILDIFNKTIADW